MMPLLRRTAATVAASTDASKSIAQGCIALLGSLREVGRWRRHLFEGAARAIEEDCGLKAASLLKTRGGELPDEARQQACPSPWPARSPCW